MADFSPTVYLPEALDLHPVFREAGMGKWVPYAEWFVSAVADGDAFLHKQGTGYVPLSDKWLRRGMPVKSIQPVRDLLVAERVLECDGDYFFDPTGVRRGKPLGYRLGRAWRDAELVCKQVVGAVPCRKLRQLHEWGRTEQRRHLAGLPAVHRRLYRTLCEVTVLPGEETARAKRWLDDLRSGEPRYKRDSNGRVHHTIANLPADLRHRIRFSGDQEWAALDITNAQPLLAGLTVRNYYHQRPGQPTTPAANHRPYCAPFSPPGGARRSEPADLTEYVGACLEGQIYEVVQSCVREYDGLELTRKEVKAQYMRAMYDHPSRVGATAVGRALRRRFPSFVTGLKVVSRTDDRHFACHMQELESRLTITLVADTLTGPAYGIPTLTVHDCVLVHPDHVNTALDVIRGCWREALGVTPPVGASKLFTDPDQERQSKPRQARGKKAAGKTPWVHKTYAPAARRPPSGRGGDGTAR